MLRDNLVFGKTYQDGDLIELRATAFSGRAFAVQDFYVSGKSLLQASRLNAYVWRFNNSWLHSMLGYMSSVEFKKAGLTL